MAALFYTYAWAHMHVRGYVSVSRIFSRDGSGKIAPDSPAELTWASLW